MRTSASAPNPVLTRRPRARRRELDTRSITARLAAIAAPGPIAERDRAVVARDRGDVGERELAIAELERGGIVDRSRHSSDARGPTPSTGGARFGRRIGAGEDRVEASE